DRVTRFLVPLRSYSGTGAADPWIEFYMPGSTDLAELSVSILLRLACHWLLTFVPDQVIKETLESLGRKIVLSGEAFAVYPALTSEGRGAGPGVAAIIPRSDNPEDDLVIYEEKADRATINWILSLSKRR